jgi:hypothetical protein
LNSITARAQSLRLVLALARHTDNNTAAATAGAVMLLRGRCYGLLHDQCRPLYRDIADLIVETVGPDQLDAVLSAINAPSRRPR